MKVVILRAQGLGAHEIAERVGITIGATQRILTKTRPITDYITIRGAERQAKVVALRARGLSAR